VQVIANFIADFAESGQSFLARPFEISGIDEAVVNLADGARENWADLASVIADGEHVIEGLAGKFADVLGTISTHIDANFTHDSNGFWPDWDRLNTRAEDLKAVASIVAEQAFGHLTARRIAGTENQNALSEHVRAVSAGLFI
jgi:hypothetical protein